MRNPDSLTVAELRLRLLAIGVGVPDSENVTELAQLLRDAGTPAYIPPALRCFEKNVLYVGTDIATGAQFGDILQIPPGTLKLVGRAANGDLKPRLDALRAVPRSSTALTARPKLLVYFSDDCVPEAEEFFDLAYESLVHRGLGAIEALGNCYGSHPESRPVSCGSGRSGPCRAARADAVAAFAPYRFALAIEKSAGTGFACRRHVGSSSVIDALAAGTVPIYQGPFEADEVLNPSAMVFIPTDATVKEGLTWFYEAINDPVLAASMSTAAAFPPASANYWFNWLEGLRGIPTLLGIDAASQAEERSVHGPHMRCEAHAVARQGTVGRVEL